MSADRFTAPSIHSLKGRILRRTPCVIAFLIAIRGPAPALDYVDLSSKENLLPNPGFELINNGRDSSKPDGWTILTPDVARGWEYDYSSDSNAARSGERSVRFANVFSRGYDRLCALSDHVPVLPEKRYLFRIWHRTAGVDTGETLVKLKFFDVNGDSITDDFFGLSASEGRWSSFDLFVHPPSDGPTGLAAATLRVFVYLDHTPGDLWIDDVGLYELTDKEVELAYPYGRFSPPKIRTTGELPSFQPGDSVSIRQDETGAFWFVRPDGAPFYRTATDYYVSDDNTALTRHVSATRSLSEEAYLADVETRAYRDLRFNSAVRLTRHGDTIHDIKWRNFSTHAPIPGDDWIMQNAQGELFGKKDHYFPDPFNPDWQLHARLEAEGLAEIIEDKYAIGYWTDNEWVYGPLFEYIWSSHCGQAFIDWLRGELAVPPGFELNPPYEDIESVNTAWSSEYHTYQYESFGEIRGTDKPRARAFDDPVKDDLYAFERVIFKKYVDTIISAIREREDYVISELAKLGRTGYHHNIFSCRIGYSGPGYGNKALKRNMDIFAAFDGIAVNAYPGWQLTGDYHHREYLKAMKETLHETTGKPVIISEFGVGARDAGVPGWAWRGITLNTQAERGRAYRNMASTFANLPWVIGHVWYKWSNGYGDPYGSKPRNCGIVDDTDRYYRDLTNGIVRTNVRINDIRRSGSFSLDDINWQTVRLPVKEGSAQQ